MKELYKTQVVSKWKLDLCNCISKFVLNKTHHAYACKRTTVGYFFYLAYDFQ